MDSPPSTDHTPKPVFKTSELFCDPSADIVFMSSDEILFKIHGTHLKSNSAGLSVPDNTLVGPEPTPLPEPAEVLEILFQFVEPPSESQNYRQPSVIEMEPSLFFDVAEAAEKYIVYGAMNICLTRMYQIVSECPLEVLNHCAKHGYLDLADQAAEQSLSQPLKLVASTITAPGVLARWLTYYDQWREVGKLVAAGFQKLIPTNCAHWHRLYTLYLRQIDEDPTNLTGSIFKSELSTTCSLLACPCRSIRFHSIVSGNVATLRATIPNFRSIQV